MGLSRVDELQWLVRDEHFDDRIALKRDLLATRHDDVFQALPGTEDACSEILDEIGVSNGPVLRRVHPLEEASLLVQEDMCVLMGGILAAACVCFPSHWRLIDKIGLSTAALHDPVHGYDTELSSRVDTFIARLAPDHIVARRNFSLHERADLFAPNCPPDGETPPGEQWLRSDYETLRRFPRTGAVLFTILTQQVQLRDLDPEVRARLAARLEVEPEQLIAYRNLTDRLPDVIEYLRS
jgi:hypothetical protein